MLRDFLDKRKTYVPQAEPTEAGPDLIAVDISHHQPDVDFDALYGAGVVGVILKCTEGTSYVDDTFHDRYQAAREAGLSVASYHFLRHGSATAQMQWYLDQAMPDYGERLVIDYEVDDCTVDDLVQAAEYLLADSRNIQVAVYGASKLTDDVTRGSEEQQSILKNTSLWAARYSSSQPEICTKVWPYWSMWQFTDNASVPGIEGGCDGNRFNGDADACLKWFGPAEQPQPAPGPHEYDIVMQVRDGSRLLITGEDLTLVVNGELWSRGAS